MRSKVVRQDGKCRLNSKIQADKWQYCIDHDANAFNSPVPCKEKTGKKYF
jgi:hypothetical protein